MDTIGKKLGLKEKMAYGCGDAASNIIWASTGTFLMFYYTDVVNINAATIGVIFLIARVINAVVALLTGWLIDNTHSKYGKARPWLLWFAVPFGIVTFAIFAILILISLFIISNTIKLTVHARRKEISIMKYVGATNRIY